MSFENKPNDAVIIHCCRTPLLRASKKTQETAPALSTLLSTVLTECIQHVPNPNIIQDICVGNVLSPPSHLAAFRMAAISSGIPTSTPISVINRQCASGLEAMNIIANSIMTGQINVGVAAGAESMSHHKMADIPPPSVDWDVMKKHPEAMDCLLPMGITSENVAKQFNVHRVDMDKAAYDSHRKASQAQNKNTFKEEIIPIQSNNKDTGVRPNTSIEALSKLKPVFKKNGCTTAGNASQITDGAAAILLMSRSEAMKLNVPILATWRGCQTVGVPPKIMGIGPVNAVKTLLSKHGVDSNDIDLFEINEAFASQFLYSCRELDIDVTNKVNVNGGAMALGKSFGLVPLITNYLIMVFIIIIRSSIRMHRCQIGHIYFA